MMNKKGFNKLLHPVLLLGTYGKSWKISRPAHAYLNQVQTGEVPCVLEERGRPLTQTQGGQARPAGQTVLCH